MKTTLVLFTTLMISLTGMAQDFKLKVWPNGAPDSNGMTQPEELFEGKRVRNVRKLKYTCIYPSRESIQELP